MTGFLPELHLRSDLDCSLEAPGYRTLVRVHFKHPGHGIAHLIRIRHMQFVFHVDPPNDEDTAVLLNLTKHLSNEIFGPELYRARSQRAGKRARESATRRGNDIVDGRRMGLDLRHVGAIMLRDRPVNTKKDGLTLRGQGGRACGASQTTYLDPRLVGDF